MTLTARLFAAKLELIRRYRSTWERAIREEGGAALSVEQVRRMKNDIDVLSEIEADITRLNLSAKHEEWVEKRSQWVAARRKAQEITNGT